jgi:hypothetical protein
VDYLHYFELGLAFLTVHFAPFFTSVPVPKTVHFAPFFLIRFYLSFRCPLCAVFLPFFTPFSTVHFAPNFAVHFAPIYAVGFSKNAIN